MKDKSHSYCLENNKKNFSVTYVAFFKLKKEILHFRKCILVIYFTVKNKSSEI